MNIKLKSKQCTTHRSKQRTNHNIKKHKKIITIIQYQTNSTHACRIAHQHTTRAVHDHPPPRNRITEIAASIVYRLTESTCCTSLCADRSVLLSPRNLPHHQGWYAGLLTRSSAICHDWASLMTILVHTPPNLCFNWLPRAFLGHSLCKLAPMEPLANQWPPLWQQSWISNPRPTSLNK